MYKKKKNTKQYIVFSRTRVAMFISSHFLRTTFEFFISFIASALMKPVQTTCLRIYHYYGLPALPWWPCLLLSCPYLLKMRKSHSASQLHVALAPLYTHAYFHISPTSSLPPTIIQMTLFSRVIFFPSDQPGLFFCFFLDLHFFCFDARAFKVPLQMLVHCLWMLRHWLCLGGWGWKKLVFFRSPCHVPFSAIDIGPLRKREQK